MDSEVTKIYGNKVRTRVCGICQEGEKILLVNHSSLGSDNFWAPPGGGIEFGDSLTENLKREFMEETGLIIDVGRFLFGCEYINNPLHSVELYFEAITTGGKLKIGTDPEYQIIKDVRFFDFLELKRLKQSELHGIFSKVTTYHDFRQLQGFYRI